MAELTLQIANDFAALGPASEQARNFLESCEAPMAACFLTDLVIEELVTNTVKYGYDSNGGVHDIVVTVSFQESLLRVEVRDHGNAFDPLAQAAPDLTVPAEEREIGGLGIHLVRQMTDDIHYERHGDENVVIATKTFPAEPSAC